jgi:lysophospholipase L1-like esterase
VVIAEASYDVVVLGDSITMGVWADTRLGAPNPRFYWQSLRAEAEGVVRAFVNGVRINDLSNAAKYARMIDRYFGFIARKNLSGLIGTQDYSLRYELGRRLGRDVNLVEATVLAGSYQISDVALEKIDRLASKGALPESVELVVIDFHGMDVVFNGSVEDFAVNVQQTLLGVGQRFPEALVLVAPLLDVTGMVLSVEGLVTIPLGVLRPVITCRNAYDKVGFSEALGLFSFAPAGDPSDYLHLREARFSRMQDALREEVRAFNDHDLPYENWQGRAGLIRDRTVRESEWPGLLAVDCIHPNIDGQRLLVQDLLATLDLWDF